jgi:hypothetical protein
MVPSLQNKRHRDAALPLRAALLSILRRGTPASVIYALPKAARDNA